MNRLFLIDGTALAYRSYFAFIRSPLINSRGEAVSAPFGFANTLVSLIRKFSPDYLIVAFDSGKPTFRSEIYPDYKATRQRMPDEMREQLPRIREVVEAMNIPVLEIEGYEADDLIGTVALRSVEAGFEAVVVTGDKDFCQLVRPGLTLLNPKAASGELDAIDELGVVSRLGIEPARVTDLLGLSGDASDNIPGVPNVGPKTALGLLEQYGDLEGVLAHADRVKQARIRENLQLHAHTARLSKRLATIVTDVDLDVDFEGMRLAGWKNERLVNLFRELEFGRLVADVAGQLQEAGAIEAPGDYRAVTTPGELDRLIEEIRSHRACSVDLETTSLDSMAAEIVGISIAVQPHSARYIPVGHRQGVNLNAGEVKKAIRPVLEDPGIAKCGQNVKYDTTILERNGIRPEGFIFDTMVASYVINPSGRQHSLDALSLDYLGHRMVPIADLIGSGQRQKSFADVPIEKASDYSCEDADITLRLKEVLEARLGLLGLDGLFREIEMPLVAVLRRMELAGVAVDIPFLRVLSDSMTGEQQRLEGLIYEAAGEVFNINSTQQLGRLLFEKFRLPSRRKTKTGYSTDVDVLEELAPLHPLPAFVLDYRKVGKLISTYVDALPRLVNPATGRVHTSFNQTVTATGRLSSSSPNLQNIPVRTEMGRDIRRAFVPGRDGWRLLSADYSQVELRIMADLSGDPELRKAFLDGVDVHTRTASLIFNTFPEMVTAEMRAKAKTVNFGVIYGQTAFGLARQLGIDRKDAREFIERYFATYPGVRDYMDRTVELARRDGYVATVTGRRRYIPEIGSANAQVREFAERTAINSPIQGAAADLIKKAMIAIDGRILRDRLASRMILQVHDELLFELPENEAEHLTAIVVQEMEGALQLSVPLKAEVGVGRNWLEAH